MGDRSNIMIRNGKEQVCFYNHWGGPELFQCARQAIVDGERAGDFQYFTAIVMRKIFLRFDPKLQGTTSIGITQDLWDNEYPVLILDCKEEKVWFENYRGDSVEGEPPKGKPLGDPISFEDFKTKWPDGLPDYALETLGEPTDGEGEDEE